MNNPFNKCNSNAEIIKMLFELSSNKEYTREQLNKLADIRRKELKDISSDLRAISVNVPEENSYTRGIYNKLVLSGDFVNSSKVVFLKDGRIMF